MQHSQLDLLFLILHPLISSSSFSDTLSPVAQSLPGARWRHRTGQHSATIP